MELNEVLINALAARAKSGELTIEQVPVPYQEEVQNIIEKQET